MPKSAYKASEIDALLDKVSSCATTAQLQTAVATLRTLINAINAGMTIYSESDEAYHRIYLSADTEGTVTMTVDEE